MDFERLVDIVSSNFEEFEICYSKIKSLKLESREVSLSGFEQREEEGFALRVKIGKRMAFSYTFSKDEEGLLRLIKNLSDMIPHVSEDEDYGFIDRVSEDEYRKILGSANGKIIPVSKKIEDLLRMEEEMRKDRRIVATRHCELVETEQEIRIFNSNGLSVEARKILYVLSGLCVSRDKDEVSWYDYIWATDYDDLDFLRFATDLREKALSFLGAENLKTGIYSGILSPRASSEFLAILSHSFLSENLFKDKTRLKGRLGSRVFSPLLTIESDGSLGMSALPFDGEGFPCKPISVVESGYFRSFLYDSFYARKYKVESTGNCLRESITQSPRCGVIGMYIVPSESLPELRDGEIVIEDLMGTHTANPITGEFSFGAQGYIMRNGVIRPFIGVIVAGNIFELFKNVKGIGKDLKFYGNFGSPSLYVTDLKISGL